MKTLAVRPMRQCRRMTLLQDVRRQFYGDEEDRLFLAAISSEIKAIDKIIDDGRAVLQLLEMHLVNVACNDPGAVIGNQLILPMLQERLDDEARQAAERQAAQAELNLMQMEVLSTNPSPVSMLSQQGR